MTHDIPIVLLWLLVERLAVVIGGRGGVCSGFLLPLPAGVAGPDVDDLVFGQRHGVAGAAAAVLEAGFGLAAGARVGLDVLGLAGYVWVHVGLHVSLAAAAGGVGLGFDGRGLEVGGIDVGRGGLGHVACFLPCMSVGFLFVWGWCDEMRFIWFRGCIACARSQPCRNACGLLERPDLETATATATALPALEAKRRRLVIAELSYRRRRDHATNVQPLFT